MTVQTTQRGLTESQQEPQKRIEHWNHGRYRSQDKIAWQWDRRQSSAYKIFTQHVDFSLACNNKITWEFKSSQPMPETHDNLLHPYYKYALVEYHIH